MKNKFFIITLGALSFSAIFYFNTCNGKYGKTGERLIINFHGIYWQDSSGKVHPMV